MAKTHWEYTETHPETGVITPLGHGCQHTLCAKQAVWQWQREATETEVAAEQNLQGPHGDVIRNPEGPHNIAVFACDEHTPKTPNGDHDLDRIAARHNSGCAAPDPGCEC